MARSGNRGGSSRPSSGTTKDWRGNSQSAPVSREEKGSISALRKQQRELRGRRRLIAWSGSLGALLIALLVFLLWINTPLPVVVLTVHDYDTSLPPNGYALEVLDYLTELEAKTKNWRGNPVFSVRSIVNEDNIPPRSANKAIDDVEATLKRVAPAAGDMSKGLIVYLSGLGAVKDDRPYLLMPDNSWLSVDEVLEKVVAHHPPKDEKNAPPRLVIIDAVKMVENWEMGMLGNTFAEELRSLVENRNEKHLFVLNSTSPNQISWSAPELDSSVFGYFVTKGMLGAADEVSDNPKTKGNDDGTISVEEIADYVTVHVERWVQEHRGITEDVRVTQTPMLIKGGAAKKSNAQEESDATDLATVAFFDSAESQTDLSRTSADFTRIKSAHDQLSELWQWHADELVANEAWIRQPLAMAHVEHSLVRMEQYLFAGRAYFGGAERNDESARGKFDELFETIDEMRRYHFFAAPALAHPAYSFALASQHGNKAPQEAAYDDWLKQFKGNDARLWGDPLEGMPDFGANADEAEIVLANLVRSRVVPLLNAGNLNDQHKEALIESAVRAIRLRRLAEKAAAPRDVRAFDLAYGEIGSKEQQRRLAVDQMFFAESRMLDEANRTLGSSSGEYAAADNKVQQFCDLIRRRDLARAHLPHLLRWKVLQHYLAEGKNGSSREDADDYLVQWNDLEQVEEALWSGTPLEDDVLPSQSMRQPFDEYCREIRGETQPDTVSGKSTVVFRNGESLRKAWFVLQIPLLTGSTRNDLREAMIGTTERDSRASAEHVATGEDKRVSKPETESAADSTPWIIGRSDVTMDFDMAASTPAELQQTERKARRHALALASNGKRVHRGLAELKRSSGASRSEGVNVLRSWTAQEPAEHLATWYRARQSKWHAERALEDFWKAPGDGIAPSTHYFARAAQDFRNAASASQLPKALADSLDVRSVNDLYTSRLAAAKDGVDFYAATGESKVVRRARNNELAIKRHAGLPDGLAFSWIANGNTFQLPDSSVSSPLHRLRINVGNDPSGDQISSITLEPVDTGDDSAANDEDDIVLTTFYRGHAFVSPFAIPTPEPLVVTNWEPPKYGASEVTVVGKSTSDPHIMFILDCSESMEALMGEVRGNAGSTRLQEAASALKTIVARLEKGKYNINIMLMGHRVVVGARTGQKRFAGYRGLRDAEIPTNINPGTDVEHLGEWRDVDAISLVVDRLVEDAHSTPLRLKPYGQTPLYFALKSAVDEMGKVSQGAKKQIVVITDGVNYVGSRATDTTRRDVELRIQALKLRDFHIDVMQLDERTVKSQYSSEWRGLRRLAASTYGGEEDAGYHSANAPSDLQRQLERLLEPDQYSVAQLSLQAETRQRLLLNETTRIRLPDEDAPAERLLVTVHDEDKRNPSAIVEARGGESLVMEYNEFANRDKIRHYRFGYLQQKPFFDRRLNRYSFIQKGTELRLENPFAKNRDDLLAFGPKRVFVAAHEPVHDGSNTTFWVSFQNDKEELFAPRPRYMWAEITPVSVKDGQVRAELGPKRKFMDIEFEQGTPVPLLKFRYENWRNWSHARIELFATYQSDLNFHVEDVRNLSELINADREVLLDGQFEGAKAKISGRPAQSDDLYRLTVRIDTSKATRTADDYLVFISPPPTKLQRGYSPDTGRFKHDFWINYHGRRDPQLRITTLQRLKENAVTISGDEAIIVQIGNQ